MKPLPRIRLRVFPIAALLFSALWFGFEQGQKAAGLLALQQRDYPKALELFSQINYQPGIGGVYLALNQPDEAIKHYQAANDASGLGLSYCRKHDFRTALAYFQTARDDSGCGLAYLGLRDENKAKEHFARANDWSGLGLLALARKDYKQAESCFSQVLDHSGLGLTALQQEKFREAAGHFNKASDTAGLGLIALATQNHRQASRYFLSNNDLSGQGYAQMGMGDFKKAREYFVAANQLNGLGDLYSRLHAFGKARELFAADNNPVKVIQSFRNDYTLADRLQQAIAYGNKALPNGVLVAECLMEMADIYYELGQIDVALGALDQVIVSHPGYASEAHLRKGRIYFFQRDLARSKVEFEQVKPNDFAGEDCYQFAQKSLADIAAYEGINVKAAESF